MDLILTIFLVNFKKYILRTNLVIRKFESLLSQKKKETSEEGLLHLYQFESMRKYTSHFAKDRFFNGYSDKRSIGLG